MFFIIALLCLLQTNISTADTIDNYMNINNNIPKMEMKADSQSQIWARSARNVLAVTAESVAETIVQANDLATNQGHALFCLPAGMVLDAMAVNNIIVQTYQSISSPAEDKDKMTVSQVAWVGIMQSYPCRKQSVSAAASSSSMPQPITNHANGETIQHLGSLLTQ